MSTLNDDLTNAALALMGRFPLALADKARRRHPEIKLLRSWDLKARKPVKEDE